MAIWSLEAHCSSTRGSVGYWALEQRPGRPGPARQKAGLRMVRPGPGPPECSADGMQAPVYRSGQSMTFGQAAVGSQLLSGIPAPSSPDAPPRPATSLPAAPGAAAPSLQTPHSALPRTTHCQGPLLPAALGADCLVAQIGTPKSQHPKPSPKSSASWEGS